MLFFFFFVKLSFPVVQGLLELGAGVSYVEALLADGVVAVKVQKDGLSHRVDLLSGLSGDKREGC